MENYFGTASSTRSRRHQKKDSTSSIASTWSADASSTTSSTRSPSPSPPAPPPLPYERSGYEVELARTYASETTPTTTEETESKTQSQRDFIPMERPTEFARHEPTTVTALQGSWKTYRPFDGPSHKVKRADKGTRMEGEAASRRESVVSVADKRAECI